MDWTEEESLAHVALYEFIIDTRESVRIMAFNKILVKINLSAKLVKIDNKFSWKCDCFDDAKHAEELFQQITSLFDSAEINHCMSTGATCYLLGEYHSVIRDTMRRIETLKMINECGM